MLLDHFKHLFIQLIREFSFHKWVLFDLAKCDSATWTQGEYPPKEVLEAFVAPEIVGSLYVFDLFIELIPFTTLSHELILKRILLIAFELEGIPMQKQIEQQHT